MHCRNAETFPYKMRSERFAMGHRHGMTPGWADENLAPFEAALGRLAAVSRITIMGRRHALHREAEYTTAPVFVSPSSIALVSIDRRESISVSDVHLGA
jgi:hypothetical protein